ncbi:recombinase family protein [Ammoniphilus sp. YIM 78166]|uniref:recombinase family protein n=1 Tax=Ammoniphilus sp. YIM 78166 TaxID=1644106 RepID=UPI001070609E|nr:recombinase family protein [Ammoniphilus sp. YIM 78166]
MGKLYGYARVSAAHQDLEIQIEELQRYGVDELFYEKMSGKNMNDRTEFKRILEVVQPGDTVVGYKLDRMGRSISDVLKTYESFTERGIHLVCLADGIDTRRSNDIMTKAMVTLLGLFAEMERNFISERTMSGKIRARENGIKFGRKGKNKDLVDHAIDLWKTGEYTIKQIEKKTTVTKSTLYREIEKRGLIREA